MIQSVHIDGAKAFADPTDVPCRPITVLTGSNSCGKSSVIQAVLLLKQLATLPGRSSTLVRLNGPIVAQGTFSDWSTDHKGRPFSIGLDLDQGAVSAALRVVLEKGGSSAGDARLRDVAWSVRTAEASYSAEYAVKSTEALASELEAALDPSAQTHSERSPSPSMRTSKTLPYHARFTVAGGADVRADADGIASLEGLSPSALRIPSGPIRPESLMQRLAAEAGMAQSAVVNESDLTSQMQRIFHLGPLRDEPRMIYTGHRAIDTWDVGVRGERAAVVLAEFGDEVVDAPMSSLERGTQGLRLAEAVAAWAMRIGVASDVLVERATRFGTELRVRAAWSADRANDTGVHADLLNVGIGVSQVLPLLVLCLGAPPGSTVLLEQPELHLHPAVQSRLGDFFAACALSGRQVVLETHSEHIINRLRLLVARGTLDAESDVAINFIERYRFGSEVTRIAVGEDGALERWPRGFFDESQAALRELMKERLRE